MEELRSQTEEMVKDLQREMYKMKEDKEQVPETAKPQPSPNSQGFFDQAQASSQARQDIFEAAPPGNRNPGFGDGGTGGAFTPPAPENFGADSGGYPTVQPQQNQQFNQPVQGGFANPQGAFQAPQQNYQQAQQQVQQAPQVQQPRPQPAPAGGPATQPFSGGQSGSYGMGVRQQVFEVIVRQALAGAPWREICAGPMQVNNISPDEVEAEVKRRQSLLNK